MKKLLLITAIALQSIGMSMGQGAGSATESLLGLRIKKNGLDYLIYADYNLSPNMLDYRKINYQVYFRKVGNYIKEIEGKKYQLITIPGSMAVAKQNGKDKNLENVVAYPRAGTSISKEDYDHNFWIDVEIIEKYTDTEYYKYSNDYFSGMLTAPFKYRLKMGMANASIIDGDLNIAPFFGWKWRVSSTKPNYIAPFIFAGATTLTYNSANNSRITDADITENGVGLTYGLGFSFRFGDISPGFILGWDKGFGNLGEGFKYSDKAWISFSVNFDFFKPIKDTDLAKNH